MNILVTGSMAYDHVMSFPDSFKNHILPDQIHILSVAFTVDKLHKNLGGCAGNMAHTMNLLGGNPLILSPLGKDSEDYIANLKKRGLETKYIRVSENKLTASAHITTDKDDNQITAFYVGALEETDELSVADVEGEIELAIVGPTKKEGMMKHANECIDKNISFVFDPGQMITAFSGEELLKLIKQAKFLIANDYEMRLIREKTAIETKEILDYVDVMITTLGGEGSRIETSNEAIDIGICPATSVEDPTGAGDAYRGGFFTAYVNGHNLKTCGQIGAVAAVYAVEHHGTQEHKFTHDEFVDRYEKAFGEPFSLKL